jgi:hypothetical protein
MDSYPSSTRKFVKLAEPGGGEPYRILMERYTKGLARKAHCIGPGPRNRVLR